MPVTFPALADAEGRLDAKRRELKSVFDEAGPDLDMDKITSISGDSLAKVEHIRALNTELDELAVKAEGLRAVAKAAEAAANIPGAREPGDGERRVDDGGRGRKRLGEHFVASQAYKARQGKQGPEAHIDVELKTLMETGAGWAPETTRTGRLVEFATRPLQVIDLIPGTTTNQTAVVYMEETTYTNAAAETAEAATYPESALALTEKSSPVRKIATWLPVTDEQLEDEPQAAGYINNRLPNMLRQRLDTQILVGNGTAPNLRGILNTVGIQTQAKGADPTPDAIYKAMTKVKVTGRAMPNAAVLHPNDWQDIRLLRTADGIYIWGSPSEAGPARIWGLPVVEADGITENTGLVGDFANYSELSTRRGIDVQVSNSHSDFFINGKLAVRADMRVALVVYRPAAFATVTGI
ncbi:phage major capsid protein [Allokutzneria sp. A3M-2-11 16]|uniref:phage major capsid protein n=1 Tax=Allokutzneria sp. A3M-2-11 16 TaxID=2962043 RepID=UPI0020B82F97|nr:phage major capsid protein [Allokutzneria sp. A3M-2-11 16]MCP3805380.1 phage major capsid protein [Allokutzneria sp. A3M-2-11 16]